MRGILVSDERKMFIQAVFDGQLPTEYITDKELMMVYDRLWKISIEKLLPHCQPILH